MNQSRPDDGRPARRTSTGTSRRQALWVGAASATALGLGSGVAWWRHRAEAPNGTHSALWQTTLPRPDGSALNLGDFQKTGLVLNFWATWCPPCVREFPQLDAFSKAWASRGWRVLGLAVDQLPAVQAFLLRQPVSFPIAVAGAEALAWSRELGNDQGGLPFTAVFAPGGMLKTVIRGETTRQRLDTLVASLAVELPR